MKAWQIVLVICLVVATFLVTRAYYKSENDEAEIAQSYQAGYGEGYDEALETGRGQGYDVGHYDGWWKGYDLGYDEGITYGRYLAGERPISVIQKMRPQAGDWRNYWRDQGIYDRGYSGPFPEP